MTPNYYVCTSCGEKFLFKFHQAYYYTGTQPVSNLVSDCDLLAIPTRHAWCKDCNCLTLVEDIEPLRVFEHIYGVIKSAQQTEYPFSSEHLTYENSVETMANYLRWRMTRKHAARAVCCGSSNYQLMDVAQPLLKHAECDFGVVEGVYLVHSFNSSEPGIYAPANFVLCTAEGEPIGTLTWRKRDDWRWEIDLLQSKS